MSYSFDILCTTKNSKEKHIIVKAFKWYNNCLHCKDWEKPKRCFENYIVELNITPQQMITPQPMMSHSSSGGTLS